MTDMDLKAFYSHLKDASDFFRVGQVFMMLWNVEDLVKEAHIVADDQPSIEDDRIARTNNANYYIGNGYARPYTGIQSANTEWT